MVAVITEPSQLQIVIWFFLEVSTKLPNYKNHKILMEECIFFIFVPSKVLWSRALLILAMLVHICPATMGQNAAILIGQRLRYSWVTSYWWIWKN